MSQSKNDEIRESVKQYYSEIAKQTGTSCGCSPSSCCGGEAPSTLNKESSKRLGYAERDLEAIPVESNLGLGCGNPTGLASLRPGERVLDLGSGGGIDCFIAARNVGKQGFVTGVDMSPAMVAKAQNNAASGGFTNVEFHLGTIEHLPVPSNSYDVVISNCVINLSPEKPAVFSEIFRALKPGGRLAVSDIIATSPLPAQVRGNDALYCACIGGAASQSELIEFLSDAGFEQIRITPQEQTRTALRDLLPTSDEAMEVVSAYIEAVKPGKDDGSSKEYFDTVAGEWDTMRKGFFPDSVRDKALSAASLTASMTVADIGAGSGFLTEALLKEKVSVIAVDQSAHMLEIMKTKFGNTGDVQYRVGTAEHLPIDSGTIERVFANMVLHHVDQPAVAIKEMVRTLKPGGRLVLTDLDEHTFEFLRIEHHDRWMGFRWDEVKKWFEDAGLRGVTLQSVGDTCCATSQCGCSQASVSIFIAVGSKMMRD